MQFLKLTWLSCFVSFPSDIWLWCVLRSLPFWNMLLSKFPLLSFFLRLVLHLHYSIHCVQSASVLWVDCFYFSISLPFPLMTLATQLSPCHFWTKKFILKTFFFFSWLLKWDTNICKLTWLYFSASVLDSSLSPHVNVNFAWQSCSMDIAWLFLAI